MSNSFTVNCYSPSDVSLTIGGYVITGWDNFTISRRVKGFSPIYGIRGKNTRVKSKDTSATISISLIQTSPSNDVLGYIHELDLDEGTARINLMLKDTSGKSVFSSNEAFITSYPTVSYTGDFTYRNWEIFLQSTNTYNITGNSRPSTSLFDSAVSKAGDLANSAIDKVSSIF
ncbi:hypothetical protein [Pseudomonas sp.]|uniref:hypothetical protein n=1 Tax=Pseudomonas sp. TaxID=306 RepID=UPI003FD7379A